MPPGQAVRQHFRQAYELIEVIVFPIREQGGGHSLAGAVDGVRRELALRRDLRFPHASVLVTVAAPAKSKCLQPCNLPAYGRVIAPDAPRQIDHADRSEAFDDDQQRKQRALELQAGY